MIRLACFARNSAAQLEPLLKGSKTAVLHTAQDLEACLKGLEKTETLVVVFEAPWILPAAEVSVSDWLAFYEAAIALHQKARKRLVFVHATRHDTDALAKALKLQVKKSRKPKQPEAQKPRDIFTESFFASHLPTVCELYRGLQLMAVGSLPEIDEPQSFFDSEEEALSNLLGFQSALATAKNDHAKTITELNTKTQEIQKLKQDVDLLQKNKAQELQALKQELEKKQAEEADLKSENDLLLAQLHQVQEELERYYLKKKDLEGSLNWAKDHFRNARRALFRASR